MKAKEVKKETVMRISIISGLLLALILAILATGCASSRSGCPGTSGFSGYHK